MKYWSDEVDFLEDEEFAYHISVGVACDRSIWGYVKYNEAMIKRVKSDDRKEDSGEVIALRNELKQRIIDLDQFYE